ncbi:hypothetical protein GCM10010282_39510 [Streptomyces roseolus]|nr:hypothetical protein GCM10010282_39510 [Streptomyces roseolus]
MLYPPHFSQKIRSTEPNPTYPAPGNARRGQGQKSDLYVAESPFTGTLSAAPKGVVVLLAP